MKKLYILIYSLLFLNVGIGSAQYTILLNFNGANGKLPHGSLTIYGNKFFGMTEAGGAFNSGNIFSVDTNGTNYKDLWDFQYLGGSNGAYPYGSLTILGNKLFGMTEAGGTNGTGNIFSIDTNGTNYKDIWDFVYGASSNGAYPYGVLLLSGNVFYGMTSQGGTNYLGNIFRIDTNGSGYTDLLNFDGGSSPYGSYPEGSLILSGAKLYGMTNEGGPNNDGSIFSVDTNGSNYKDMLDFNGINGSNPRGSLTLLDGLLYGMADLGGTNGDGNIFSIDTNGTSFTDRFDFNGSNGNGPFGDITASGKELYGMTEYGGATGEGVIFSMDTSGSNFKKLFEFNSFSGINPVGMLTISGKNFYGMALKGGLDNGGVIFRFDTIVPTTSIQNTNVSKCSIDIFPNPSNGKFTINASLVNTTWSMVIYNVLGEKIYSQPNIHQSKYDIDLSSQPGGVYFYKTTDNNDELIGQGKLIVQK